MGKIVSLESEGYQYDTTIASPKGGKVEVDTLSDPMDSSGYSKDDTISLKILQDKSFINLLENTKKVSDFSSGDFGAIVVVSGQGPMFTCKQEADLQNKFLEFYNKGRVSAAICNGTSLLLYLKDKDGNLITYQQQHSGAEVAKLVIDSLGK